MSHSTETVVHDSQDSPRYKFTSPIRHQKTMDPCPRQPYVDRDLPLPSKRTDVFRHVFQRPRHTLTAANSFTPMTEHRCEDDPVSSNASKRRVAFHDAITSFFHSTHSKHETSHPAHPAHLRNYSSASSCQSRGGPGSVCGSLPSLDLVSPDTFFFSGPSLGSFSVSLNSSMSHQACLTENSSSHHSLRHIRFDSLSARNSFHEDAVFEPSVDDSLFRNMSDILLNTGTPTEELGSGMLRNTQQMMQSFPQRSGSEIPTGMVGFGARLVDRLNLRLIDPLRKGSQATDCS